jgi:WhiB family transcriptional regulator, redox-sensing transcriptional regulator
MRVRPAPADSCPPAWEPPGEWVERAQCAQSGFPDAWFPDGEFGGDLIGMTTMKIAKRICRECPVRLACLNYALQHETGTYRWGIYGGLTPTQRYRLSRRRAQR